MDANLSRSLISRSPIRRSVPHHCGSVSLSKPNRAGELTAIWIPDAAHEAIRRTARQHLQGFLLRHERIYCGARAWTLVYRRWLTTVRFEHPAQQIVLQDYIHAVQEAETRRDRLTQQIEELLPNWSMAPVVAALQAMRGVALVVAVTVVAEVGDFRRFANGTEPQRAGLTYAEIRRKVRERGPRVKHNELAGISGPKRARTS